MEDEVLAVVAASTGRRVFGIAALVALGMLLLYVGLTNPPANPVWQVFLLIAGLVAVWLAERMRRATMMSVELTATELRSSDGERIAAVSQIAALDRGMFAFKPSNGFMLKMKDAAPARWQPGLWWRIGRRVGIGGVTPGAQTKIMADILSAMLVQR